MILLIISHTPHYLNCDGSVVGWGSTVMEIDQLATLFSEVIHLALLQNLNPPGGSLPYQNQKVRTILVKPAGGKSWLEKISYIWRLPDWLAVMKREIRNADVIHIRCPAIISLLALFAVKLWAGSKPCWVKYAGNWLGRANEPLTYYWQRKLLLAFHNRCVVTINGRWSNQPQHVHSFYNPSFSVSDLQAIKPCIEEKSLSEPLQLLFVGRTDHDKGVGVVLTILEQLLLAGIHADLALIGDSPERQFFEQEAIELGVSHYAHFLGWKDRLELDKEYAKAHFIILPSVSEGWPKVLSEAMAYGVVPLASDVSSIPQILGETRAGHAFPANQPQLFVDKIIQYTLDKEAWKITSQYGKKAANLFTYETYLDSVRKLFYNSWRIELIGKSSYPDDR